MNCWGSQCLSIIAWRQIFLFYWQRKTRSCSYDKKQGPHTLCFCWFVLYCFLIKPLGLFFFKVTRTQSSVLVIELLNGSERVYLTHLLYEKLWLEKQTLHFWCLQKESRKSKTLLPNVCHYRSFAFNCFLKFPSQLHPFQNLHLSKYLKNKLSLYTKQFLSILFSILIFQEAE